MHDAETARNGDDINPARVVAPTRVNVRQRRSHGARRRSLTHHEVEGEVLEGRVPDLGRPSAPMRWISSTNRTVSGCRLVRIAARSPARTRAPARRRYLQRDASISLARMCASVVFPSPGGPKSSTWSSGLPRVAGRADEHLQVLDDAVLPHILRQMPRPGASARPKPPPPPTPRTECGRTTCGHSRPAGRAADEVGRIGIVGIVVSCLRR